MNASTLVTLGAIHRLAQEGQHAIKYARSLLELNEAILPDMPETLEALVAAEGQIMKALNGILENIEEADE